MELKSCLSGVSQCDGVRTDVDEYLVRLVGRDMSVIAAVLPVVVAVFCSSVT